MTRPADRTTDPLEAQSWDLIVAGAGCAGMATALFAAIEGLSVLVVERSRWVGGTSALAAGAVWIPNTHLSRGSGDTAEKADRYLAEACMCTCVWASRHCSAFGPSSRNRLRSAGDPALHASAR